MSTNDLEDLSYIKPLLEKAAGTNFQSRDFDLQCSIAISLKRIANALEKQAITLEEQLILSNMKKSLDPSGEK